MCILHSPLGRSYLNSRGIIPHGVPDNDAEFIAGHLTTSMEYCCLDNETEQMENMFAKMLN